MDEFSATHLSILIPLTRTHAMFLAQGKSTEHPLNKNSRRRHDTRRWVASQRFTSDSFRRMGFNEIGVGADKVTRATGLSSRVCTDHASHGQKLTLSRRWAAVCISSGRVTSTTDSLGPTSRVATMSVSVCAKWPLTLQSSAAQKLSVQRAGPGVLEREEIGVEELTHCVLLNGSIVWPCGLSVMASHETHT